MFKTDEMVINMGPQHPSTHGVLRVVLKLDGETVVDADCVVGYLHRGIEKLAEGGTYPMFMPYTDRTDYVAAISNNLGYVQAVEKMMGVKCTPRAEYIRMVLTEFSRISSHLLWLATHALDIGAMTVFLYCFREREDILDLFEDYCGARLTTNAFRIGGLHWDLPEKWVDGARKFCAEFPAHIEEYESLIHQNRMWLQRTKGIGVISAEDAIALGLSGPSLRGSGVSMDLRKDQPYGYYHEVDFDVPVGDNGDTYDRYLVRMEELRQCLRIILQGLDKLPDGDIQVKVPKTIKPNPGEVYHSIEAPKGELGYFVISDGTANPHRVRIRPPSFINLESFKTMIRGHKVADVVAIIGTLDIVLGEVDR